jgi:hypothetical protein
MAAEPARFFVIPRRAVEDLILSKREFVRDLIGRLSQKMPSPVNAVRDYALRDAYDL